jgi:transposase, IS30 family
MLKNYTHLSESQRYQIEALLKGGKNQTEIANIIGKSKSCISRELRRNTPKRGPGSKTYSTRIAQRRTTLRHKMKPKAIVFDEAKKSYARSKLVEERWSPEIIHEKGKEKFGSFVSHEWLYQWIWNCKFSNRLQDKKDKLLYRYLAHGKRRRKRGNQRDKRGLIPNRVGIENRPKIVDKRRRIGDLEVDLMIGKDHQGALLVMTDRATLLTGLGKVGSRESSEINQTAENIIQGEWVKSFTFDNDMAFSQHEELAKRFCAKTFFTRPYTSQDKGTVENRIGIIRRFFPKKTDLTKVPQQEIYRVQEILNNRPVRKFGYKTPNQVFSEKVALIS